MKKILTIIISLFLLLNIAACTASDQQGTDHNAAPSDTGAIDNVILKAKVIDINESSALIANMDGNVNKADIYIINISDVEDVKAGSILEIEFDGTVMDSFPMQIGNISKITVKEQGEDIAGLYRTVVKDLFEVDPGLNDNIQRIAFDLSKVSNLKDTEKTALIYSLGNTFGLEAISGTFDELSEQGYIDKENLYFETGILIIIEDTPIENNGFTFDAHKWRSGTGAYFYNDCEAIKTNNGWTYTIGSEAIS
jgi:hypothetical protein